jgi:hypothetical protein
MLATCTAPESAVAAANIVKAMTLGSVPRLEEELDWASGLHNHGGNLSSYDAERVELLGAIADQMRNSLRRMRRLGEKRLAGAEANLRLLEHLAGYSRSLS